MPPPSQWLEERCNIRHSMPVAASGKVQVLPRSVTRETHFPVVGKVVSMHITSMALIPSEFAGGGSEAMRINVPLDDKSHLGWLKRFFEGLCIQYGPVPDEEFRTAAMLEALANCFQQAEDNGVGTYQCVASDMVPEETYSVEVTFAD